MNAETQAVVLRVACLTTDRDTSEQRAMLDLALDVDRERGKLSASNRHPTHPCMVALVEVSYDPSAGRHIKLTAAQAKQYDRLLRQWFQCEKCKHPMGAHYEHDACPSTPHDLAWLAEAGL